MCTLAIFFQCSSDFPVVVAANRDEFYDRAATPPRAIIADPWIVAGIDVVAGGTWLGVNSRNLVSGMLNRRTGQPPDPTRRSRGLLCLEALHASTVDAAADTVCRDRTSRYNPFNLLLASPQAACAIGNVTGSMVVTPLRPGVHLLSNLELNDPKCSRIAKSYRLFDGVRPLLRPNSLRQCRHALQEILADHSTPLDPRSQELQNNLCVHTERYGTRSSTLLVYCSATQRFRMWHADGPPCRTPYTEITLPDRPTAGQPPDKAVRSRAMRGEDT